MTHESFYMGRDGFIWFHGVVEDRQDPDKLGKIKVRILGFHTKDKSFIKSEELQWAYVIQPLTSAAMNGIGTTPLGVVPGTWVFGFFRDGEACQEPCIVGTIGGIPQNPPNNTIGFSDPRDSSGTTETLSTAPRHIASRSYPKDGSGAQLTNGTQGSQFPLVSHLQEPDTNRIARNEKIEQTVIQIVKNLIDTGVPISYGGTWDEPPIWYAGIYPYIHVKETESGHVKVEDDTPNKEGQLDFDRTGSFIERLTDGSEVHKIVKDGYTVVMKDDHVHIMGNEYERCDHEYNLSIGGRWNIEVNGNINIKSDSGGLFFSVSGDANINANGKVNIESSGDTNIKAKGNINIGASEGEISLSTNILQIKATTAINMDSPALNFNSGLAIPIIPSDTVLPKQ
jgi:hypothetical protein